MANENEEIMVVEEETEETIVEEKRTPKGAIVAGVAAAAVGIGCGIKWMIGKLRDSRIDYDYSEDDFEDEDDLEVEEVEEEAEE